jgi:hypothetical protein
VEGIVFDTQRELGDNEIKRCLFPLIRFRVLNLWDIMDSFRAMYLVLTVIDLDDLLRKCQNSTDQVAPEFMDHVLSFLETNAKPLCDMLKFTSASQKISLTVLYLRDRKSHTNMSSLHSELRNVKDVIISGCYDLHFIQINSGLPGYINNNSLFGDEVLSNLPLASEDIKNSGNCLAVELPTAAVFHLMRVSEHGLRYLAKKLRATVKHNKSLCPLEYAEWDKVITAVKNKIEEKRKLPKGPQRQAKLEFFSEAADHCLFMKEIWRNNISHTRRPYTQTEAMSVFERVRDFMQFLAKGIR